jgi:hypothetical protein
MITNENAAMITVEAQPVATENWLCFVKQPKSPISGSFGKAAKSAHTTPKWLRFFEWPNPQRPYPRRLNYKEDNHRETR